MSFKLSLQYKMHTLIEFSFAHFIALTIKQQIKRNIWLSKPKV